MATAAIMDFKEVEHRIGEVINEVETVIIGKRDTVSLILTSILCNGHILIEDVPGVGKTTLAKSIAKALGCTFKRIQFTPDLLPADVTGTSIFNQKTSEFEFRRGPVFAQFILADEINRATPKTQSSLLECMEERQVTVDGITYPLPAPFFVVATENSVEYHGTYPLPEAQLDRFMMRLSVGYPDKSEESHVLDSQSGGHPIENVRTILSPEDTLVLQQAARDVYLDPSLRDYIVEITSFTRSHPMVALGASPRGSLSLARAARAQAAVCGRGFVLPDDIKKLTTPVLAHRLVLRPEARVRDVTAGDIIEEITASVAVPC